MIGRENCSLPPEVHKVDEHCKYSDTLILTMPDLNNAYKGYRTNTKPGKKFVKCPGLIINDGNFVLVDGNCISHQDQFQLPVSIKQGCSKRLYSLKFDSNNYQ